jgi:hypothetical protein
MAEPRKQGETPAPASAVDAVASAPAPSNAAKTKVAVDWPTNQFVVEGLPVITREGTQVTAEQYKQAEEAAKRSGVQIHEVNG